MTRSAVGGNTAGAGKAGTKKKQSRDGNAPSAGSQPNTKRVRRTREPEKTTDNDDKSNVDDDSSTSGDDDGRKRRGDEEV